MKEHLVMRFPLPVAFADPAFKLCVLEAADTPEMVEGFDRLYGGHLGRIFTESPIEYMVDKATGFRDEQFLKFAEFVHQFIYLLLPDDAIVSLRIEP